MAVYTAPNGRVIDLLRGSIIKVVKCIRGEGCSLRTGQFYGVVAQIYGSDTYQGWNPKRQYMLWRETSDDDHMGYMQYLWDADRFEIIGEVHRGELYVNGRPAGDSNVK